MQEPSHNNHTHTHQVTHFIHRVLINVIYFKFKTSRVLLRPTPNKKISRLEVISTRPKKREPVKQAESTLTSSCTARCGLLSPSKKAEVRKTRLFIFVRKRHKWLFRSLLSPLHLSSSPLSWVVTRWFRWIFLLDFYSTSMGLIL